MSYLSLPGGLSSFSKAIISFWFRVPQASINAASSGGDNPLDRVVPLVVMGQEGSDYTPTKSTDTQVVQAVASGSALMGWDGSTDTTIECVATVEILPGVICCTTAQATTTYPSPICGPETDIQYATLSITSADGDAGPTDPTVIGIRDGLLYVNFESGQVPAVTDYSDQITSITPASTTDTGDCVRYPYVTGMRVTSGTVLCCVCPIFAWEEGSADEKVSPEQHPGNDGSDQTGEPAVENWTDMSNLFDQTGSIYCIGPKIKPDVWHHLLVSVDFKAIETHGTAGTSTNNIEDYVSSAAKLYVCLDDKNLTGYDVGSFKSTGNDVITDLAERIAGAGPPHSGGIPGYSLAGPKVPSGPLGIPAHGKYVHNIHHVEMAEFQMWTGKTLDPADVGKRRLFINIKEHSKTGKLEPVDPKVAEAALGKPELLLHGSSNWKKGINTGMQGNFNPVSQIEAWKPDPVLGRP